MSLVLLQESVPWAGIKWLESTVFYSLIGISLIVGLVAVRKYHQLNRAMKVGSEYAAWVARPLKTLNWDEALSITKKYSQRTHLAEIVLAGLEERERLKGTLSESRITKHMSFAMERMMTYTLQKKYKRGLGFIDAIGSTAPFIGALGGSAITFAFGTMLAIPTIWFATYFRNKTIWLEGEMKAVAGELISIMEERMDE